jgi:hypothetical protein
MKITKLVALLTLLVVTTALAVPALAKKNQSTPLSDDEIYWLKFIGEEEKMARDVYTYLYNEWGLRIFYNIKASEQIHMDKVKGLLDKYGIADPADGKDYGEFENDYIQGLYDDLTDKGDNSKVDALEVGIIIEETDIGHLGEAIEASTHNDIINVYTNLREGSYNHLAAFTSQLAKY